MAELDGALSPLVEAIEGLRGDLAALWQAREGPGLAFRPSPVELTLQVAVTGTTKASGGVKWWLVNIGGEVSRLDVSTHTVKLTLEPVILEGDGSLSHDSVLIDSYE